MWKSFRFSYQRISVGVNKNVLGMIMDELGVAIMRKFIGIRHKMYLYLTDYNEVKKKTKYIYKCVIKHEVKFDHYGNCFILLKMRIIFY